MKRQEHVAEVEEVAIRVRVENLKNGRYLCKARPLQLGTDTRVRR